MSSLLVLCIFSTADLPGARKTRCIPSSAFWTRSPSRTVRSGSWPAVWPPRPRRSTSSPLWSTATSCRVPQTPETTARFRNTDREKRFWTFDDFPGPKKKNVRSSMPSGCRAPRDPKARATIRRYVWRSSCTCWGSSRLIVFLEPRRRHFAETLRRRHGHK